MIKSRPSRTRGLKQAPEIDGEYPARSRPSRTRGLKLIQQIDVGFGICRVPRGRVD